VLAALCQHASMGVNRAIFTCFSYESCSTTKHDEQHGGRYDDGMLTRHDVGCSDCLSVHYLLQWRLRDWSDQRLWPRFQLRASAGG